MLTAVELRQIALNRLNDAEILFNANSFDGASYVCGYSVEIGLKAKICATTWWSGFPSSSDEFSRVAKDFKGVWTHDLESLLRLSGEETAIKAGANRQRIAKSGGSFIRHRITPLNVRRGRHIRRRLVAVPTCTPGGERHRRVAPEAGDRVVQRVFSRPFVRFPA